MILGSKIGSRFKDASLETCTVNAANKAAVEHAKKIVAEEIGGLIITGPVGTGKTHIIIATLNDIEAAHIPVIREMDDGIECMSPCRRYVYWKANDLANAVRSSVADMTDPVGDANRADVLFIDDLGTEYEKVGSDFIWAALQAIFDYRWENEKPLMVTTNLDAPGLAKRYGDRVLSRWRGSCKMLSLRGDDRRDGGS